MLVVVLVALLGVERVGGWWWKEQGLGALWLMNILVFMQQDGIKPRKEQR